MSDSTLNPAPDPSQDPDSVWVLARLVKGYAVFAYDLVLNAVRYVSAADV